MAAQIAEKYQKEMDKARKKLQEINEKYEEEIDKARKELHKLVDSKELSAFDMLRLAYASQFSIANYHHDDAGRTTSTDDKTKETDQSAKNNYLQKIAKIKDKCPTLTSPNFYQLAGIVAVKTLGGPEIDFVPHKTDLSISPDESWLPDITLNPSELRAAFSKVKISDSNHIVALYGGLKLATDGAQDAKLKFDNSYFVHLSNVAEKDLSPSENAMLKDEEFGKCVKRYAMKNEDFFNDYKVAHKKLFEFDLPDTEKLKLKLETQVKKVLVAPRAIGVGVVVAAAVVILSVFYVINRRRAKHSSQQFQ